MAHQWADDHWQALAVRVSEVAARGQDNGRYNELGVRWQSVAEPAGRLAWVIWLASEAEFVGPRLSGNFASTAHLAMAETLIGISLWRLDLRDRRIRANGWSFDVGGILGPPADGMSIDDLREYIHPEDLEPIKRAADAALLPGAGFIDVQARYRQPDGTYCTLLTRRMAERDADGRAIALVGVSFNISALVEAQRREEAAAEANRAKSQFLANMSHELRTPMNAILGMSHLALGSGLNAQQHNYISKVERAAKTLLGVLNDVLDFSKIEAGKLDVECIGFRLSDVMDNLASLVALQAEEKGLELVFSQSPDLPDALQGDPLRVSQVLVNLCSNALKFTERGEVVVGVEQVERDGAGVVLRFFVRDTGPGMSPAQQQRMFQPFTQADSSTSRRHGGTGLGLAISHRLVQMLGGQLELDSLAGVGSRFWFKLRFALQPNVAADRTMLLSQALRLTRILVVDDNNAARDTLVALARSLGMHADEASDGDLAVRAVAQAARSRRPYDVVLLDWKMPGIDGVACASRIQDLGVDACPMLLMTTAFGREPSRIALERANVEVCDILVKPVTPSTLFDACAMAIGIDVRAESRAVARDESVNANKSRLRGSHVLLVEDNAMNQELALALLESAGIVVTVAGDGREALALLAHTSFDAVLMDCQMPVMDGYEATRAIRAAPQWQSLPVIAMTANAMSGDRDLALSVGMNDHIAKPIDVARMFETLARWFHGPAGAVEQDANR